MPPSSPLVLVTGSSGYIGIHIVRTLLRQGFRVRGTVRNVKNESKTKPLRECCPEAVDPLELVEADLLKDDGWEDAFRGCTFVIHVASPFPNAEPKNPDDLIQPALEGTKRVLKFAAESGTVKRAVITSSIGSVHGETVTDGKQEYTEDQWTDLNWSGLEAYAKSKTLAEKAAWDFVKSLPHEKKFELVTINPSLVLGPVIHGSYGTSVEVLKRLMDKTTPLIPYVNFAICDVRDVAKAHVKALTVPEAAGHRHIINTDNIWLKDMAQILRDEFSNQGYYIPFVSAPNLGLWLVGFVDKSAKMLVPRLGKVFRFSNKRMTDVLGITPTPLKDIVLDTAHSLIEAGIIPKTNRYQPSDSWKM